MFKLINLSLGRIKVGVMQVVSFPYENIDKIISMQSPCDCNIPENDITNSRVIVKYTPKPIPEHLRLTGVKEYSATKQITIKYTKPETKNQEEVIILNFSAIIFE